MAIKTIFVGWGIRFAPLTTLCACGQYAAASGGTINRVQVETWDRLKSGSGIDK